VTDTYFVVAHFHYIIFGAAVFPIFGGMYYWFPKVTGKLYFERPGQISFWTIFVGTNLLFFPMHIVGLLGMPRRVYTYPGGVGWTSYNLIESVGGYITAIGIVVLFANLVCSYFRGAPAGPDPWHGPTLEWTIPSPPPEYNFATIPTVTSAYPNWEDDGSRGGLALDEGHKQHVSTIADGWTAEVVDMPHASPWPILLATALTLAFVLLVVQKYLFAAILLVVVGLTLIGWHSKEPQENK
jgi:heme/copper-type cytochrome/quinol oxidase subunit 1